MPGYHLRGSNEAECDADGIWAFNYNEAEPDYDDGIARPVCERITCEAPAKLANGSFPSKEYHYGDVVAYKCDDGYDIEKTEAVVCTGSSESSVVSWIKSWKTVLIPFREFEILYSFEVYMSVASNVMNIYRKIPKTLTQSLNLTFTLAYWFY